MSEYDVVIVGGGPAGLAAALYTARMDLKTVVVDRGPLGGQLLNTELIEDYPGFESILGSELATKMGEHARRFGVEVRDFEPVKEIDVEGKMKVVRLESGEEIRAPALIMAAGGLPRYLQVPGEKEFWGRGVSYCAVCDGAFFKGEELAVIGGGRRRGVPDAIRLEGLHHSPTQLTSRAADPDRPGQREFEDRVHLRRAREGDRG